MPLEGGHVCWRVTVPELRSVAALLMKLEALYMQCYCNFPMLALLPATPERAGLPAASEGLQIYHP